MDDAATDLVVSIREPGRVPLHLVVRQAIEVGRSCAGLLVDDPQVSRRHIVLRPDRGRLVVDDLGSTNGTFIDGERLDGSAELSNGSTAVIGNTTIELDSAQVPTARARDLGEPARRTSIERVADAASSTPSDATLELHGGTRTIVFSDIEGSTERAVELGDVRWFEVLSSHEALVNDEVSSHRGVVVKSQGDGFMLAFDSARRAVSCMIAVQRRLHAIDPTEPQAVRIRVGAHTGEAIEDGTGDLFGQSVIIAARIANAASGGEILVSSLVREIIEPRGDVSFGTSRSIDLKGIAGAHLVHPIEWDAVS